MFKACIGLFRVFACLLGEGGLEMKECNVLHQSILSSKAQQIYMILGRKMIDSFVLHYIGISSGRSQSVLS